MLLTQLHWLHFSLPFILIKLRKKKDKHPAPKMHSPCILLSRNPITFIVFLSYLLQTQSVSAEHLTASTKVIRNEHIFMKYNVSDILGIKREVMFNTAKTLYLIQEAFYFTIYQFYAERGRHVTSNNLIQTICPSQLTLPSGQDDGSPPRMDQREKLRPRHIQKLVFHMTPFFPPLKNRWHSCTSDR